MKRRRRRAPVSTLRARLGRRVREKEEWPGFSEPDPGSSLRPFFLTAVFRRMHSLIIVKITVAVAVVFLAGLLYRGDYAWGRPVLDGLRFVTSRDLDLKSISDRAAPAFRSVWNDRDFSALKPGAGEAPSVRLPLDGELRSGFGLRTDPESGREQMHYGIDLTAPEGAPVRAMLGGVVSEISEAAGIVTLVIDHGSGWQTVYRGLAGAAVEQGGTVEQGRVIGSLAGRAMIWEKPHLHFELRLHNRPVHPPPEWLAQFSSEPAL